MPVQHVPPAPTSLTYQQVLDLEKRIDDATSIDVRSCANCAVMAFGHEPHWHNFRTAPMADVTCGAFNASPIVCQQAMVDDDDTKVYLCQECRKSVNTRAYRASMLPVWTPEYADALATLPYNDLHRLSFVDVSYKMVSHAYGYVHGEFCGHSLVNGPLLLPRDAQMAVDQPAQMQLLWDTLPLTNSLYQFYTPLHYRDSLNALALPADAWHHIVSRYARRDPVTERNHDDYRNVAALDVFLESNVLLDDASARVGTVQGHEGVQHVTVPSRDVLYQTGIATLGDGTRHSIEHLLFPAFFPHGTGFYHKPPRFTAFNPSAYLKFRCLQGFSPFTKQSAYLLLLRSLENARAAIAHSTGRFTVNRQEFERAQATLAARAEDANEPPPTTGETLSHLVKHRVSDKVDGSPQSFKRAKRDLDCLVGAAGMAHYFVTVTMNETGGLASVEYGGLASVEYGGLASVARLYSV